MSVLQLSWTDVSNDRSSGRKVSFFSATAKRSRGKYKETTFTISPCVHVISSSQYRSGSRVEVADAVRDKVCENAPEF